MMLMLRAMVWFWVLLSCQTLNIPSNNPIMAGSDQRAAADKQLIAQPHRSSCLRLRYSVEASMPSVLAA